MVFSITANLYGLQSTLGDVMDVIEQRVDDPEIPVWCASRGWADFLIQLSEEDLNRCESFGLAAIAPTLASLPSSLAELAHAILRLSRLPVLESRTHAALDVDFRGVSSRKRQQLTTLLGVLEPLVESAARIVDVGAGSGHFTRLSAQHFARSAIGVEQNAERVARAAARAATELRLAGDGAVEFLVCDAVREPLELHADDLAIGLHACGELGDTLVRVVADSGARLALVSCCLQKISAAERTPLSRAAAGFALQKDTLGLSNLTSQAVGVETSIEQTMRARQARYALRLLLRGRGLEIAPGAEMHGINRRRARDGLSALAERALALGHRQAASPAEVAHFECEAAAHFKLVRRLSLARNMLGPAIELCVVLDRAARLEESGQQVLVTRLFERAVTPRNVALFASCDGSRLPRAHSASD